MTLWNRLRLPPLAQLALLVVTFAAAAFLSLEVWMQAVRHTSLCTTTGCAVVGEYIRFGEGNLLKFGAAFFWLLWLVAFFAGRYPKAWIWGGFGLLVAGALAFDGTLLGFQFVALREFCLICAITGGLLGLTVAAAAWVRRSIGVLVLGLAAWSGGFAGSAVLDFQVQPPALQDTVFVSWGDTQNATAPRHVLFFSFHCGHCSKVLANLAINVEHLTGAWYLAPLDGREEDFYRMVAVQKVLAEKTEDGKPENPFVAVLRQESMEHPAPVAVPESLRQTVRNARSYFKTKGFDGVPVLVVWQGPGRELILRGETAIFRYLRDQGWLERTLMVNLPPQ